MQWSRNSVPASSDAPPRLGPGRMWDVSVDPLYLVACGMKWHKYRDTSAGWELVQSLRSADQETRMLAACLLANTEHGRLRAEDVKRVTRFRKRDCKYRIHPWEEEQNVMAMHTPYGIEIIDNCMACKLRKENWFCTLSAEGTRLLGAVGHASTYPGGAVLFVEGQSPRGAVVLCSGRAKLSTTSREGKVLILRIAEAGEVLGLSAAIAGEPYELTAETVGPCHINFIEREALLGMIERSAELGLHASVSLSKEFQASYRDMHDLVLTRSSAGKLARLLLSWTPGKIHSDGTEIRIRSSLTHEEMAQMIGSSRETVTRLLGDLKRKDFIRLEGSTLIICNRNALEALAA